MYGASKLLVGQRGGGNSINHNIDSARHSSHSMGEGVWVNSSSSNAGSGSGRSSTLTSSSTTRTSSEDDEAIIADALFRVAMDLEGLHIIDVEPLLPTQNVSRYLGVVCWDLACANVSFFVSMSRLWSSQHRA